MHGSPGRRIRRLNSVQARGPAKAQMPVQTREIVTCHVRWIILFYLLPATGNALFSSKTILQSPSAG
jgi:hypothetical protein